jgi:6-phosphogluconolactonase/glucosamine-6-phosphate isomerase/deaminase
MKIINVKNSEEGVEVCKNLLYEKVSKNSVLFLSGGSTPKTLYEILAKEKLLKAGAVALVDERYFSNLKPETNEFMIRQTGLVKYLEENKTRFYPILEDKSMQDSAKDYDETMRYLFNYFPKSIGILGVGVDGHVAGIPAFKKVSEQILSDKTLLISSYDISMHHISIYQTPRITFTFNALSRLDEIIVLVFGKDKKKALRLMLKDGSLAEIPSRFLTQAEITERVTLITDQL